MQLNRPVGKNGVLRLVSLFILLSGAEKVVFKLHHPLDPTEQSILRQCLVFFTP